MASRTLIYARVSVVDSEVDNQLVQLRQYALIITHKFKIPVCKEL
jgi:predicted site-specific integrase-resolvase